MANERYLLHVWGAPRDYDGKEENSYATLQEAKEGFDERILKSNCNYAALYDTRNCKKALWTFPSYWDGHDHTHGRGFDPKHWKGPEFEADYSE